MRVLDRVSLRSFKKSSTVLGFMPSFRARRRAEMPLVSIAARAAAATPLVESISGMGIEYDCTHLASIPEWVYS